LTERVKEWWNGPAQPAESPSEAPAKPTEPRPKPFDPSKLNPEMRKTYDRAVQRFGKIPGAEISVTASPASEGKPVVTLRHAQADPKNLTVQTHFHGYQHMDKQVGYDKRIGDSVAAAWAKDPNRTFVLPDARNEGAHHSDWNNVKNVTDLTRTAVEGSGLKWEGVKQRVISGHSAGGSPVAKALSRAQQGQEGRFDRVELYDPAFNSSPTQVTAQDRQRATEWVRSNQKNMLLVPGTMNSPWMQMIDRNRWTSRHSDHFSPLWQSLGQLREPRS
jgi:hypothetical protein